MTSEETITLTRKEYDDLIERNSRLEDMLAARDADDGVRVPHQVALAIMRGKGPHLGVSGLPGHDPEGTVRENRHCLRVPLRD